jgi:hypothetical protein
MTGHDGSGVSLNGISELGNATGLYECSTKDTTTVYAAMYIVNQQIPAKGLWTYDISLIIYDILSISYFGLTLRL